MEILRNAGDDCRCASMGDKLCFLCRFSESKLVHFLFTYVDVFSLKEVKRNNAKFSDRRVNFVR